LPGLRRALIQYRLASNPLTGWWYRALTQFEADTPIECRLRAIANTLTRFLQEREREAKDLDMAADDVARMLKALSDRSAV
jgi:hypothetical protein